MKKASAVVVPGDTPFVRFANAVKAVVTAPTAKPKTKPPHTQTWVKVNAHVDTAMAEIIMALSAFPMLRTIESCQRGPTEAGIERPGWVCFYYADSDLGEWHDIADFVLGILGPRLAAAIGDGAGVCVRVTDTGRIQGELEVRPGAFGKTARALRRIRINEARSRRTEYSCGRSCTAPPSC